MGCTMYVLQPISNFYEDEICHFWPIAVGDCIFFATFFFK